MRWKKKYLLYQRNNLASKTSIQSFQKERISQERNKIKKERKSGGENKETSKKGNRHVNIELKTKKDLFI